MEDHRLQIEDLYSSVRICPSGSLRFGPKVQISHWDFTDFTYLLKCYQMVEEELDRPKAESTCLERFGNHSLLVTPQNKQTQEGF